MHAPFYLVTRKNKKTGKRYYQIVFQDETGKEIRRKSCPLGMSKIQATLEAEAIAKNIVPKVLDPMALDYCREFWSENSIYFKREAAQGRQLSESYRLSGYYNLKHYEDYLRGKTMSQLTACGLEDHAITLALKGVGPRSINHGMDAVKRPYTLYCEKLRVENKLKSVKHHEYKPEKRGILTQDELKSIALGTGGISRRDELIVLLGAMCGLRRGEIIGLQYNDIDENAHLVHVQHNFVTKKEGMKGPKCGSYRHVPLPGHVKWLIDEVRAEKLSEKYVVPNIGNPDKPCDPISIKRAFLKVLKAIGISDEERRSRNLVVHGLRHTFVSHLSAAGVPDIIVASLSGHSDLDMVKRYSHTTGLIDYNKIRGIIAKSAKVTLEKGYALSLD